MRGKLEDLVRASRALGYPGPGHEVPARAPIRTDAPQPGDGDPAPLRPRLAALVAELATRLGPVLDEALARVDGAWDQVDALDILDDDWRARAAALGEDWRAVGGAEALEALLVLEMVPALVALVERRLAAFVRLRGDGELRPGGRPFLDVPGALAELARRWS